MHSYWNSIRKLNFVETYTYNIFFTDTCTNIYIETCTSKSTEVWELTTCIFEDCSPTNAA